MIKITNVRKRKKESNKGITLIALVITIIVLLILAAVSIATLTGENGILTKANTAKNQTIEAEEKEQINLAYTTVMADKLHKGNDLTVSAEELGEALTNQNAKAITESQENNKIKVTFTKSKNVYIVDGGTGEIIGSTNGGGQVEIPTISMENAKGQAKFETKTKVEDINQQKFIVPAGFKIAEDSADVVEEGIVIEDTTENHNQFVWVPVNDIANFERKSGYFGGSQESLTNHTEPFANGYSTEQEEYNAMYESVRNNKGFYIGRFEAGKDSSGNVIVKKDADVYNNVPWGNSMNDIEGTSQTGGKVGAVKLAKEFASKNNYEGVTSTLCYGVQWDATLKFIDPDYTGFAKDSSKQGWHSDNYNSTKTGNTETNPSHITGKDLIYSDNPSIVANKQRNIYDMAGNVYEWSMEAKKTDFRAIRGGVYGYAGTSDPASNRFSGVPALATDYIGFRLALYL